MTEAAAAAANEEALGPGGVATPTPEPGPTPTPQPGEDAGLKPVGDLLGKKAEEAPKVAEAPTPEPGEAARSRIQGLTAEKWALKRQAEAAEARAKLAEETLAELTRLNGGVAPQLDAEGKPIAAPAKPAAAKTFTQREVEAEALRIAAQSQFNRDVDKAVEDGRKAHEDFNAAIDGLKAVTGPQVPAEFLAAALETGEAPELIYHLGKNPDEADRILSLPPLRQAVALQRLASELGGAKVAAVAAASRISSAPAPIKPRVGGGGTLELDLEKCSMADFIEKRNEVERAKNARR